MDLNKLNLSRVLFDLWSVLVVCLSILLVLPFLFFNHIEHKTSGAINMSAPNARNKKVQKLRQQCMMCSITTAMMTYQRQWDTFYITILIPSQLINHSSIVTKLLQYLCYSITSTLVELFRDSDQCRLVSCVISIVECEFLKCKL